MKHIHAYAKRYLASLMACGLLLTSASAAAPASPDADAAVEPTQHFSDVQSGAWYEKDVQVVFQSNLMQGTSETTFEPETTLSRGMLVQVLYNKEGEPQISSSAPFSDVDKDAWYANAVAWAVQNGVVNGYSDGTFGPNDPVTREQMATILYRYSYTPDIEDFTCLQSFSDQETVSAYAQNPLTWAVEQGLVNGMGDGTLNPKGSTTRAQAAAILNRYCALPNDFFHEQYDSSFPEYHTGYQVVTENGTELWYLYQTGALHGGTNVFWITYPDGTHLNIWNLEENAPFLYYQDYMYSVPSGLSDFVLSEDETTLGFLVDAGGITSGSGSWSKYCTLDIASGLIQEAGEQN